VPENKQDNKGISSVLQEVALLLELKGENPFKVKAYSNAARSIEILEEDLGKMVQEDRLKEIKGIGDALAHQITELVHTGKLPLHEELKFSIPPGHLEMLKVPSLGPKKIKTLYDTFGIKTIGELEYACLENRLVELQGFGQKTQEKILQGIQQVKKYQGRYLYGEVIQTADEILKKVLSHPKVFRASLAGSVRRRMEIVRDINLVVSSQNPQGILTALSKLSNVEVVRFRDKGSGRYSLISGVEVDLRMTTDQAFPFHLLQLTGNLSHWNAMCERAKGMGLKLSEEGLRRNGRIISCKEEEGIFNVLGLDFIPPELREDQGEIAAAEIHQLPLLIEDRDIQGVFHIHSLYSDGTTSIRAMAQAAKEMGLSYIGLSDHSQSARYAGGLTFEKLKKQWEEVDWLNEETGAFHIFKGIESDILPDGSLDYDEPILKQFDFVIASVHSHFHMSLEEMTKRMIKAVRNPYTTILGHPTGRLLLAREPYAVDMIRLIEEASRSGVVIELNSHPFRLDIDWRLCKYAKEKQVKLVINPDAHEEEGLKDTNFGVGIARKGWLEPGDILNTMNLEEMKEFLKKRRGRVKS
jgi:DNA polymerase (family 10)